LRAPAARGAAARRGQQDVGRLDVAVDQPAGVRGVQRAGHLGHDRQGAGQVQAALPPQQGGQVEPFHVPHGDVELPVDLAGIVDRDHVGVVDAGGDHRLAQEAAAEALVGRQVGAEDLEGDLAAEAECSAR
jgi:hypothetical protein